MKTPFAFFYVLLLCTFSINAQQYSVQLGAFEQTVSPSSYFKGFSGVFTEMDHNGFHRYYVGKFDTAEAAESILSQAKNAGLNARVVDLISIRNCQTTCIEPQGAIPGVACGSHRVFNVPAGARPINLPRLGTNPQFGTLVNYSTTQEVFEHLHRAYTANEKGNATELDKLWQSMGYTGFKDERFTVSQITPVYYDAGVTGMLGAGGNTYVYAAISPGQDIQLKGYRMTSVDGSCEVTIMEICGNAFYPQN